MEDSTLNTLQQQAVFHEEGPLMVLAGPGTGKTRILVERVKRLAQQGASPESICLVTFTRKAADEIKNRLRRQLGDRVDKMLISTLHSLALRIMLANERKHAQRIPDVADPTECYALLRRAIQELQVDTSLFAPLDIWKEIQFWKTSPDRDLSLLVHKVQDVARRYEQILASEKKWDLADLIVHASRILINERDIAAGFCAIRHLMVDEFQDTSLSEYRFLRLLLDGNRNFMMVAAAAQSIYAWRGADFTGLRTQVNADYPDLATIVLRDNYRCGQDIIETAAAMTPEEDEVKLCGKRGSGLVLYHELPDNHAEANFIAASILSLRQQGVCLPDIAVLFRSWFQASALEQTFTAHQIPYTLSSEQMKLYDRREVREMTAYIQVVSALREYADGRSDRPEAHGALDLILNTPPRGIGQRSKRMIRGETPEITFDSLARACARSDLRDQVRQACAGLFELLYHFAREGEAQPAALITQIIDQTGWFQSLQNDLDGRQAIQRLRTLQEEAALYQSLPDFLQAMAGKVSFQLDEEGVALSTIHGAKGLEWPVVFLSGFNQGILPAEGALRSAYGGDPVEERHVAHVALSRARDLLVLSWFRERVLENGRSLPYRRSDLISLIPKEKIYAYRSPNDLQVRSPDGLPESHYAAVEAELETSFLG